MKPFEFDELLVRIKALLKRSRLQVVPPKFLQSADLKMNLSTMEVSRANIKIRLIAKEFALPEYLILNKGKVVPKIDIAEKKWDINLDSGKNVIEVYVSYLRNKLTKSFLGN